MRVLGYQTMLLISNDPLAPRQRLASPSIPLPSDYAWLADPEHLVTGRGRITEAGYGWIELREVEQVDPFRFWDDPVTVFAYNPTGSSRESAERPDQRRFRKRLLHAYRGRCAVTDCDAPELLDAAHLRPWRLGDVGVLLRTDLHRMIDNGLAEIRSGRFHLVRPLSGYEQYNGARLRKPRRLRSADAPRDSNQRNRRAGVPKPSGTRQC